MTRYRTASILAALLLLLVRISVCGQDSGSSKEFWPKFQANIDLAPRVGVQVYTEKHNGEDFSFKQWKVGGMVSYRVRRMLHPFIEDIDHENQYNLALAGGYEFINTEQSTGNKHEHRIIVQGTPKYMLPAGILVQDRNRNEFRWTDGTYDFRYRNKLTVDRAFKIDKFRLTPYASGELFWDRNHHEWNENQYAFGLQIPYKKLLMVDTYYLRQNCTTCSQNPLNVFGIKINVY